eukprot:9208624-Pyramimonas_sp.AAC.1
MAPGRGVPGACAESPRGAPSEEIDVLALQRPWWKSAVQGKWSAEQSGRGGCSMSHVSFDMHGL